MGLSEFAQFKEGNRLEMKAAQGRDGNGVIPRSAWETLSAFANTSGGVIVLGAEEPEDDTFNIVGIKKPDKVIDDFWNAALSDDKVSARFMQDSNVSKKTVDGKDVVIIRVPRADRHVRPVYINGDLFGGTFRRTHTGDHRCSHDEVLSMLRDSSTSSQDGEIAKSAKMEYLNRDTVAKYRRRFDSLNDNHVWSDFDELKFLEAIGAVAPGDDGKMHPTCAGLLMFGEHRYITHEFPHYLLDYRQEVGENERWEDRLVSFSGDWTGNLYDFYFRAYNKMKAALKTPFQIEGIDRIDDTPAHRALREAIANCLTNANWYERRGVVCVWREDGLEVANPGDFRMPIEEAMKPGKSDPRNEALLGMFALVDVGERAGSGMDKVMGGWAWAGYPEPTYKVEFGPDRTTLTLPFLNSSGVSSDFENPEDNRTNKSDESGKRATERRKDAIIAYLEDHGPAGRAAIASAVGLQASRASELLAELVSEKAIIAEGATRNRTFRLVDQL
ncbi:RNA-binding domain-containing protein [Adlercreutzia sp. ZJ176]|uniref:RNA-binding domain-containing protein n=1 Tax=Adlercreutzia sp. ZJ176 TaxID=2709407 RepID=UPI0013EAEA1C|nr:RNA-binding domain-containing protein [Adlercreutzia sp. ZJ176]